MKYLLIIIALVALIFGVFAMMVAKSAIHEIEALMAGLIFTTGLAGAGIIEAIEGQRSVRVAEVKAPTKPQL